MFGFGKKTEEPEVTQDVPAAEAKAEGQKLEWGPDLGQMSWNDTQAKINELNKGLVEGEKKWRLPTKDELVAEFDKTHSTPVGFEGGPYWYGTESPGYLKWCYVIDMLNLHIRSIDDALEHRQFGRGRCAR